ncbi:glutamine--fructose-6-phosphate transaminase (isomerizing) [Actinomyces provencensis]|uniref:glutamine--fructose-6-phosphate transaminase (isomerizing) n=1 Tax=Actinomyces provencensis TaxID=1720198 RepID=UPI00096A82B1|nr:glutamine--fructose-6-phosphate transaminase (isomerizing) [Actinomyces provencensis]
MCGIVGHVARSCSTRPLEVVMDGLSRLEYRGYDSAGVALTHGEVDDGSELTVVKAVGKLTNLRAALAETPTAPSRSAIGHTRWATHGQPTLVNAHPHVSMDHRLALVHNGIIENADVLRAELRAEGYRFVSETDTEVVVHLLDRAFHDADLPAWEGELAGLTGPDSDRGRALVAAMLAITPQLQGTYTLLALSEEVPGLIVAARRSSPLVIGVGEGENFLGSDALAFASRTTDAVEVGQDQVVGVTAEGIVVLDKEGAVLEPHHFSVDFARERATKEGWSTFMEKEIHEQPRAVAATIADRLDATGHLALDELRIPESILRGADKMIIVACGTASYAGLVARYAIEHWCRIPVEVELAHEFRYRDPVVNEKTLVVAISQSGETMDTIMAIRHAREQGARVIAIVNTPGSTISRESDAVLLTHAGPEIAVASTKAFTAQIAATYVLGLYLAQVRGNKYADEVEDYMEKLERVPEAIQWVLDRAESVRQVARSMADIDSMIYLGRHVGYPVALEGALKLKELCYIHAEGFAAGELKHGPIALIDEGQPVMIIVPTPRRPELHNKVVSNIQEVRARGARTLVVAEEGDTSVDEYAEIVFRVPRTPTLYMPLLTVVPLQIFACELAATMGHDVDQPRNLAKSVTVE